MIMTMVTMMLIESDVRVFVWLWIDSQHVHEAAVLSLSHLYVCAFGECEEQQYKSIEAMTNTSLALNH